MTANDFLRLAPTDAQVIAREIRRQKEARSRPLPGAKLIDRSSLLLKPQREKLLNIIAGLVDENLFGRSEMCIQFADLLQRALSHIGLPARFVRGTAIYYRDNQEVFRWDHSWVRVGVEVIDGNTDSLAENPLVPPTVSAPPYWGPVTEVPPERRLREGPGGTAPPDRDVAELWWPDLLAWLRGEFGEGVA